MVEDLHLHRLVLQVEELVADHEAVRAGVVEIMVTIRTCGPNRWASSTCPSITIS